MSGCACGEDHGKKGHPYTVSEARGAFDAYGHELDPYMRSLFRFLLEKCERFELNQVEAREGRDL